MKQGSDMMWTQERKKVTTRGIVAVFLLILALSGVQQDKAGGQQGNPVAHPLILPETRTRLPVPQAEHLVALWVKKHRTQGIWHAHPGLKEITPAEVWQRLGAQVFRLRDDTWNWDEVDAYLIQNRKVYPLSIGFGGQGLLSLCVCDLEHDSQLELAYTYSFGSGQGRSHIALLTLAPGSAVKYEPGFAYRDCDLIVKKQNDQTVLVYIAGFNRPLGRLALIRKQGRVAFRVLFEPGLPPEWRNRVWEGGKG